MRERLLAVVRYDEDRTTPPTVEPALPPTTAAQTQHWLLVFARVPPPRKE